MDDDDVIIDPIVPDVDVEEVVEKVKGLLGSAHILLNEAELRVTSLLPLPDPWDDNEEPPKPGPNEPGPNDPDYED